MSKQKTKNNYTRKDHLKDDIIALIDESNQPQYITLEVLKMCVSEVRGRKKEN